MEYIYFWDNKKHIWYVDISDLNIQKLCSLKDEIKNYNLGATEMIDKIILSRIMTHQKERSLFKDYYRDLEKIGDKIEDILGYDQFKVTHKLSKRNFFNNTKLSIRIVYICFAIFWLAMGIIQFI